MRAGYRASRNELIKEVLRDYRYEEVDQAAEKGRQMTAVYRAPGQ
jgi:hypothetical protein